MFYYSFFCFSFFVFCFLFFVFRFCSFFFDADERDNMTLLCLAVKWCGGELHERTLCAVLLVFQGLCCAVGLYMRYGLGSMMYGWGNVFDHRPSDDVGL